MTSTTTFDFDDTLERVSFLFADAAPALVRRFRRLVDGASAALDVDDVQAQPLWAKVAAGQHDDGSFGDRPAANARLLSTLWTLRTLTDLGGGPPCAAWAKAHRFLADHAVVDGGFSFTGERAGVLSCYTGLCASMLQAAQEQHRVDDDVEHTRLQLVAWLHTHQQVQRRGDSRRAQTPEVFHPSLATRYGGCFASTSCFTGVVRAAQASPPDSDVVQAARAFLLERRVMQTSAGRILPLVSKPSADDETRAQWLKIHHPVGYHVDLLEALQVVTSTGAWDARMQPAVAHVLQQQLDDGTWPLQAKAKQPGLWALERVNRRRGSPTATVRVLEALAPVARDMPVQH